MAQVSKMIKNGLLELSDSTNRSECWKSFKNVTKNGKKIDFVVCRTCSLVMKYNSAKTGTKKLLDHHRDCFPQQKLTEYTLPRTCTIHKEDLEKIKSFQALFSIGNLASFKLHESKATHDFVQACINIGAKYGRIDSRSVLASRKAVKDQCIQLQNKLHNKLIQIIKANKYLAFTTDIWSSSNSDSFLEVHLVYLEDFEIKTCQLFMIHFDIRHTTANIYDELITQFRKFCVDTSHLKITTDSGANILAAVNNFNGFRCACHRLSTCIEDAWKKSMVDQGLSEINEYVNSLLKSIAHRTDFQRKLPKKVKTGSQTRAWRGLIHKLDRVHDCYDSLGDILASEKKGFMVFRIDKGLLKIVIDTLKPLEEVFNKLESTNEPNLNLVVPTYFILLETFVPGENESINCLNSHLTSSIKEKFWPIIKIEHWVASFLDPKMKNLIFVPQELRESMKVEIIDYLKQNAQPGTIVNSMPKKPKQSTSLFERHFQTFEEGPKSIDEEISVYIEIRSNTQNPFQFWKENQFRLPILSGIAQQVLIVQSSSSLSERIFSHAGKIDSKQRASLGPKTLSALTQCKSGEINGLLNCFFLMN